MYTAKPSIFRVEFSPVTTFFMGLAILAAATPARACDIAVGAGSTVTLNGNVTADCIGVDGTLNIGGTLTMTGPGPSVVNGVVRLTGACSQLKFTTRPHTIMGSGQIEGQHDAARITIASGVTLISTIKIAGKLVIEGAGNFTNQATVEANTSGTLKLAVTGRLDDTPGDRWKATAASAILKFDSALVTISTDGKLAGNFLISGASTAKIEINEPNFVTEGGLQMYNGLLDAKESFTMGDNSANFMSVTDDAGAGSPVVEVAAGKTFTHK